MPGDSQVICGSMVGENHWSPASTETPANHPLWGEHVWALYIQSNKEEAQLKNMMLCLHVWPSSRAVHIEVTFSLDTDSSETKTHWQCVGYVANIFRKEIYRSIYSDNGSNFIGAEQELKKAYMEMDDRKIQSFLLEQGGDWIRWHKNPPLLASCMGGVLKRKICSYPQQELFWDHFWKHMESTSWIMSLCWL